MTKTRKRIFGIGCAAVFALSQIPLALHTGAVGASADEANAVTLKTYDGDKTLSVTLTDDGKLPELPVPVREGYDFVGWFTEEVTVDYWGDRAGETWTALKETYGNTGYTYLNGRPVSWYNTKETPDPRYADDAGYDWKNSRWIEHSVGLINATKGQKAEAGMPMEAGATLYAMYDPKNITVYWYSNGWNGQYDTDALFTGRSSGFEYGGKFARLPLDEWVPWQGHTFKGWVDANGKEYIFDMSFENEELAEFYTPGTYDPVLRLYAIYDDVTSALGGPQNAEFHGVTGNGAYFDPSKEHTFTAVFDSRYKIYPEIVWEFTDGGEMFDLAVSADKTRATVSVKPQYRDELTENTQVALRLTVGSDTYNLYATASHNWNNGKILSGQWDRCTSPMVVEYTCKTCGQKKSKEFPADGHRFARVRKEATCTEDAVEERYCVVCGKTEREILAGTALGHQWRTTSVKGCGGTVTTSVCTLCGSTHTEKDPTACHDWNSSYTIDRAPTCTSDGSKSIRCKNCDAVKESVVLPATGHNYKTVSHEATCTQSGYTESVCTACGDRVKETTSAPAGHRFTSVTETGCNGARYTVKTCAECGAVETEGDAAALAHVPNEEYTIEKAPSCNTDGEKTLRCAVCNAVLERAAVPATGHDYKTVTHEATCTQSGYTESVCTVCGDCKTESVIAAKGHVPANPVLLAPTCHTDGRKDVFCATCGELLESEVLPADPALHDWTERETEIGGGFEVSSRRCTVCGENEEISLPIEIPETPEPEEVPLPEEPEEVPAPKEPAEEPELSEPAAEEPEEAPLPEEPEEVPAPEEPAEEPQLSEPAAEEPEEAPLPEEPVEEPAPEEPAPAPEEAVEAPELCEPAAFSGATSTVLPAESGVSANERLAAISSEGVTPPETNRAWVWIALATVCGAAAICVPAAIVAVKRRK